MKVNENKVTNEIEVDIDTIAGVDIETAVNYLNEIDPFALKADDLYISDNKIEGLIYNQAYFYAEYADEKFKVYFKYNDSDEDNISIHNEVDRENTNDDIEAIKEGLDVFVYYDLWKELPEEVYPDDIKGECNEEQLNYSIALYFLGLYKQKKEGDKDEELYRQHLEMLVHSYVEDINVVINSRELVTVQYEGESKKIELEEVEGHMVPCQIDFLPESFMKKLKRAFEMEGQGYVIGAINIAQSIVFAKMMIK